MIKYRAIDFVIPEIEKVEVIRETKKYVVRMVLSSERRELKMGKDISYFDTFDQARDHLLGVAEIKIKRARESLDYLRKITDIKEPT